MPPEPGTGADPLDDLSRYLARRHENRFAELCGLTEQPLERELSERIEDLVRPDRVAAVWKRARAAPRGAAGEPARRLLRGVLPPFFNRATSAPSAELRERCAHESAPAGGFRSALARCLDPDERGALFGRWDEACDRLRPALDAVRHERNEAAQRAGAASAVELVEATWAASEEPWIEPFERDAIEPLDDELSSALRARYARLGSAFRGDAADGPWIEAGEPERDRVPPSLLRGILVRVAAFPGREASVAGPVIDLPARLPERPAWCAPEHGRPRMATGQSSGASGLHLALDLLGRALRFEFLSRLGGGSQVRDRLADRACAAAAGTLYRRLAGCPRFRREMGLDEGRALGADLALQEALVPRRLWAYLHSMQNGIEPWSESFTALFERAEGLPPAPDRRVRAASAEPRALDELRGTVYGLLLEEHLRTRFGRDWWSSGSAVGWLREVWEAEPSSTVEERAAACGLGTMEAAPVADACRPLPAR